MSIIIRIECDAPGCHRSTEINDYTDRCIAAAGYHPHPIEEDVFFCSECWPDAKLKTERGEDTP